MSGVRSLWREPEQAEDVSWPAVEFADVFKIYWSGPVETVALRGFEMRVERGELVAVLGPSGSGKSTMLALAAGLDKPSAGDVRAAGSSLTQLGETDLARYRANDIALVFQSGNLWPHLSARENIASALRLGGSADADADLAAERALAHFGLEGRARSRASALSGGEQQRVAVAAAAARRAQLVLADEPTGQLDAGNEAVVLDALARLRDETGCAVVLVTHSSGVAGAADRVVEMRDGRTLA